MQSESLYHSLVSGHANPCLLADELRAGAGGSGPRLTFKLHLPSPALQVLSCLYTAISASVVVGQSAGHPLPFLSWGPHQQLHRLLFPVQLTSLLPTPQLCSPRCQQRLLHDSQLGGCHLPRGHHCRSIAIWHSLSCHVCHRGARLDARWPGQGCWQGGL